MKNNIWGESLKTYVFFNMLIVLGRSCKDTGPKIQMMWVFKRWHHYWKLWISFFFFTMTQSQTLRNYCPQSDRSNRKGSRKEKGKSKKQPLTHNSNKEIRLVLADRVSHRDGVLALVRFLRPLYYKAAHILLWLHVDPSLSLGQHLPHRAAQSERQNKRRLLKRTVSHDDSHHKDRWFNRPTLVLFHSSFVLFND